MSKKIKDLDLIIIGGGPAGLTSAIYASRAKLRTLVLENQIVGGQVRTSYAIENYPGFKVIEGDKLADLIQEQALELGTQIDEFDEIISVKLTDNEKVIETNNYIYKPTTVIIATGAAPKKLPIANEQRFLGKGVHYCAVCDGAMYSGSVLGVVGGGNAALEEALFLAKFASKVILIRRYNYFKGEKTTIDKVLSDTKIEVMYNWDLIDVDGDIFVNKAIVKNTKTGEVKSIPMNGVFGYIGTEPKTNLFKQYIRLTSQGYIITNENMETNVEGVYAAGDVREKLFRQITTAVSDGTIAALKAEKYIEGKMTNK